MTEDYDARREKIEHRKISQGQKDLARKCHCGLIRAHHTAVQANKCKKEESSTPTETRVSVMTDRQIQDSRQMKI